MAVNNAAVFTLHLIEPRVGFPDLAITGGRPGDQILQGVHHDTAGEGHAKALLEQSAGRLKVAGLQCGKIGAHQIAGRFWRSPRIAVLAPAHVVARRHLVDDHGHAIRWRTGDSARGVAETLTQSGADGLLIPRDQGDGDDGHSRSHGVTAELA